MGSGASPAVWLSLIVILLQTLDRLIPDWVNFTSVSGDISHSRLADAFVDDTSLSFTSSSDDADINDLITCLEHIAQTWEQLLHLSGGKLNLAKCSWFIVRWEWKKGRPVIRPIETLDKEIQITQGTNVSDPCSIRCTALNESSRMLGVFLNPLGDFGFHVKQLKKRADVFASRIMSPRLSAAHVHIFHRTMYVPSMRYGLAAVAIDEEELGNVQSRIITAILKKLTVQSTIPTAIRHGPRELGGLDLYDLRTEVGIESLKFFRDDIYSESETGKLLRLNMQYSQLEADIGQDLLQFPAIHLSYITPIWILSLRQFLFMHNMSVTVSDSFQISLQGPQDGYIMQDEYLALYSPSQQRDINLVRLYLQVKTLAELADSARPTAIDLQYLDGARPSNFVLNSKWPRQQSPSKPQGNLWRRYIKSSFLRYVPYWKTSPVAATAPPPPPPQPPTSYDDLFSCLGSLPQSSRRMLDAIEQTGTDLQVWRAFRSKKRLFVATDGGLLKCQGTHGWVISTGKTTLFQCAGPVDGPYDTSSSTRCELHGYASAVSFIDHLSKFWGIRHRCRFTWICDIKAALSRVRRFALKTQSRRMPLDADLISLIRFHSLSIRRRIKMQWIKGHQDSLARSSLSVPALLNIAADSLASAYRSSGQLQSRPRCDHVPQQQCSISINNQRLIGQYDECIRFHVNGYHLRRYLQDQTQWTDKTWDSVDFGMFGQHYRRLPLRQQILRTKFVYNQLPLGVRRLQQAPVKDPVLAHCPCCKETVETSDHLLRCPMCPQRVTHLRELRVSICNKDIHPVRYLLLAGMNHWLENGDSSSFSPSLSENHPVFLPLLQEALRSQAIIGWGDAFKGFFSKHWRDIAQRDLTVLTRMDQAKGDTRLRSIIDAAHNFTRAIWLSRNSALHATGDSELRTIRDAEVSEIRHFHSSPHLLPAHDQHYCARSLEKLLNGSASNCRRWLCQVKQSINDYERDGTRQSRLTSLFQPVS